MAHPRELTKLTIAVKFINWLRNDFQFDPSSSDYCGFINLSLNDFNEELAPQYVHFVELYTENPALIKSMLNYIDLSPSKITLDETIINLIKK
jgi:hypothetical protein